MPNPPDSLNLPGTLYGKKEYGPTWWKESARADPAWAWELKIKYSVFEPWNWFF